MHTTKSFILLLFLSFSNFLHSQIIPFTNYTVKDGLPSNIIFDITQDKKGYLWFASQAGLVKFDGYNFKTFKIEDGLPDIQINTIFVSDDGKIWCGTLAGGLFYMLNDKVHIFEDNKSLSNEYLVKIFADKKKRIWCITQNSVVFIDSNKVHHITNSLVDLTDEIICHLVDSKGNIWFGSINGLYKFDGKLSKVPINWCNKNMISAIIEDRSGKIWIASQGKGIGCINGQHFDIYTMQNGLSSNMITSLFEDKSGLIYAGTFNCINVIENGKILKDKRILTQKDELRKFHQDAFGRIWIQTLENGIYLLDKGKIIRLTIENGLAENFITSLFEDNNNNIWFSTYGGGVSKFGKVVFTIFKNHLAGNDKNIYAVESFKNNIITGSFAGLTWFRDEKASKIFTSKNGLPSDPTIASIKYAGQNNLWLGTIFGLSYLKNDVITYHQDSVWYSYSYDYWASSIVNKGNFIYSATAKGLIIFDGANYKLKTSKDGLPSDNLYSIDIDKSGNIWCGTDNGLSIWDGKSFHNFNIKEGLPNNVINDIAFDKYGVAWIATDNGISAAVLEDDFHLSTKNIYPSDGLGSGVIYSILPDQNNNIWIGHNKGLDCYNTHTKEIKNYGVLEGFLPVETNMGAICMDSNKNIWIGTVEGLVKYTHDNDYINKQAPIVYILKVGLYNDTTSLSNFSNGIDSITQLPMDLMLPYSKNSLVFGYVGLQYTIVEKNKYKYRLLGYEDDWSAPVKDIQTLPYRKLPPGKYTFQVMAANCDGVWTEKPAEFLFQILPPWWKTWWAKILEFSLIILGFFTIIYLRERKLKYDKRVLTQKVKERTIEIEKQKEQIELQRDEITRQKEEITDSIIYARRIQSAILPKDDTIQPILKEYFILYKPRDIVSGDFYWIYSRDNIAIVIVADCTGHGVPGAFMSMLGVSTLNEIATKKAKFSAAQILDMLRDHLINTLSHTSKADETRDGMDISLCIIDFNSLKAQFAGAFNPLIIVRNRDAEIIKADKMPVGIHVGNLVPFTNTELQLQSGDCLYMFSDGYADQFGGPDCKKFKTANMRALLCDISMKEMAVQKQILDDTIENWKGPTEQIDDILVMGIRI